MERTVQSEGQSNRVQAEGGAGRKEETVQREGEKSNRVQPEGAVERASGPGSKREKSASGSAGGM